MRDSTQTFPWSNSFSRRILLDHDLVFGRSEHQVMVEKMMKYGVFEGSPTNHTSPLQPCGHLSPDEMSVWQQSTSDAHFSVAVYRPIKCTASMQRRQENKARVSLSHLNGHFNQHEQLFDADPQALTFHSFTYASPLYVLKTAQQLWRGDQETRELSI